MILLSTFLIAVGSCLLAAVLGWYGVPYPGLVSLAICSAIYMAYYTWEERRYRKKRRVYQ